MKFSIEQPDFGLSPYTGMARKHWLQAGKFLLDGIFSSIENEHIPPVTTAYESLSDEVEKAHRRFEGVVRTLILAVHLLAEDEQLVSNGIKVRDYYSRWILRLTDPTSPESALDLATMKRRRPGEAKYQQTVECAMLCVTLLEGRTFLWDRYSKAEQNQILDFIEPYAKAVTGNNNWRFFNVIMLSFLQMQGRPIDKEMLENHLSALLAFYAGDGWYRDGNYFDYYTAWAFQTYGPLWCLWYGRKQEPAFAEANERHFGTFIEQFGSFFSRNAEPVLWGRSGIYRFGCSTPFPLAFLSDHPPLSGGKARRILSGSLVRFLTEKDVFSERNIPCLGWLGPFDPIVQAYSCPFSVFWLAKVFSCLSLPPDSPFWTDRERDVWDDCRKRRTHVFQGPGIKVVNETKSGITELKSAKYFFSSDRMRSDYCYLGLYARLSFSSALPFDGLKETVNSQQYTVTTKAEPQGKILHAMAYSGNRGDVLYRRGFWEFETMRRERYIDLADIDIDYGTLRVDRLRIHEKPFSLTLGGFSLPLIDLEKTIEKREIEGCDACIVGTKGLKTALVAIAGWDSVDLVRRTGTNAIAECSIIPYAKKRMASPYYGKEPLLITVLLERRDGIPFGDDELQPVDHIDYREDGSGCTIELKDGRTIPVDFETMEGILSF